MLSSSDDIDGPAGRILKIVHHCGFVARLLYNSHYQLTFILIILIIFIFLHVLTYKITSSMRHKMTLVVEFKHPRKDLSSAPGMHERHLRIHRGGVCGVCGVCDNGE